ncbi:hypothetical protein PGQ11_005805 [Apiospora arundinis]|uniref:F-box domain-containing protein n=1 Tax=Apiospora arundinis TaxID=335852 RepID=A0ABR2JCX7_9PEZI
MSSHTPSRLLNFPTEILSEICSQLADRDIKTLRLICSRLTALVPLRLDRVFLSANPRDVEVFNAIAAHDVLRQQVVEMVWDDALFVDKGNLAADDSHTSDGEETFPGWYGSKCMRSLLDITSSEHAVRRELPAWTKVPLLPISEGWAYYKQLIRQQRETLQSGAHKHAFENAWRLRLFPNVRTIIITPAVHGRLFHPLFTTPMIRAFPPGFVYPIPRGWPTNEQFAYDAAEWEDDGTNNFAHNGYGWQGFRTVTSVLARYPHDLAELRVDAFKLPTGLNARVFEKPCRALADFTTIITRPSFQKLHLDLLVHGQDQHGWPAFTSGHLARALSAAQLTSLSIRTDVADGMSDTGEDRMLPLETIFRPESLARLHHFCVSGFFVREDNLIQLLARLPHSSLKTAEVSFLQFDRKGTVGVLPNGNKEYIRDESLGHLLNRMRDELPWQNASLTIGANSRKYEGRAIWVNVDDFLYRGGKNPCGPNGCGASIEPGFGVEKDLFDRSYERPHMEFPAELGYRWWNLQLHNFNYDWSRTAEDIEEFLWD